MIKIHNTSRLMCVMGSNGHRLLITRSSIGKTFCLHDASRSPTLHCWAIFSPKNWSTWAEARFITSSFLPQPHVRLAGSASHGNSTSVEQAAKLWIFCLLFLGFCYNMLKPNNTFHSTLNLPSQRMNLRTNRAQQIWINWISHLQGWPPWLITSVEKDWRAHLLYSRLCC